MLPCHHGSCKREDNARRQVRPVVPAMSKMIGLGPFGPLKRGEVRWP